MQEGGLDGYAAILFYLVLYNRMMAYVERHAYRSVPGREEKGQR